MYKLEALPFCYQDLEPYIDIHTMGLHYHKHEKNYLNRLNTILKKNNFNFLYPMVELYKHLGEFNLSEQPDIIFNLGGVVNHDLYWNSINPNDKEEPKGRLKSELLKKFGSFDKFKEEFIKSSLNLKGVGYTFLVVKPNGDIDIINTINQDNPLLFNYIPLLNIDLWEHAYYLNYQNKKQDYINNFFDIINFNYANKIYNNLTK